jgi:hypothetical protein
MGRRRQGFGGNGKLNLRRSFTPARHGVSGPGTTGCFSYGWRFSAATSGGGNDTRRRKPFPSSERIPAHDVPLFLLASTVVGKRFGDN